MPFSRLIQAGPAPLATPSALRAGAWLLALAALLAARPAAALEDLTSHNVQARVNDEVITSQDVLRQVQDRWRELEAWNPPNLQSLKRQAWLEAREELVEEALLVAAGQQLAEKYPPVNHLIGRLVRLEIETQRREMGGESRLLDYVEQEMGLTYTEYREELRKEQMREFVVRREVFRPVEVRISEMRDFYERNRDQFRDSASVRFDQIAVPLRPGGDLAAAKERARRIAERIKEGEDWRAVAEEEGALAQDSPSASRRLAALAQPLRDALQDMQPGDVSDPIVLEGGGGGASGTREVRILKLVERGDDEPPSFQEMQEAIRRELVGVRRARRYQKLVEQLREMHYVWVQE